MSLTIPDLGVIGTTDGILRPIDMTVTRNGATWDLTGYTDATVEIWETRTRAAVTAGTAAITSPETAGVVRWTPAAAVYAASGSYSGRILLTPGGGGDPEPSGRFRFEIEET